MYYIIERQYAGPNAKNLATDRKNIVDGHQYVVRSEPGVTNMSHEPAHLAGWARPADGLSTRRARMRQSRRPSRPPPARRGIRPRPQGRGGSGG